MLRSPAHTDIAVSKDYITHPRHAGFVESLGEPQGQIRDYRKNFQDKSIHVREYNDHFKLHWDNRDPASDPLGHLLEDAPHWLAIFGIAALGIGALAYFASRRDRNEPNSWW